MDNFSDEINVLNKENFENILYNENIRRLRKKIHIFILNNKNENDFFDIDNFNRIYVKDINKTNNMINQVVLELNKLGWKTHIGFGGTGLYIYSSEELPIGAW